MNKNASKLLFELRGNRTQREVAISTGLTVSAISNYEQGIRNPSPENMKKLADYYGKTVDEIFFTN